MIWRDSILLDSSNKIQNCCLLFFRLLLSKIFWWLPLFFFHLVPKNGCWEKRLLFTLLHSLSHYGHIPLERLKIGDSCSPNNKCEKSSKQALKYCLSKPHWAIWFWSNNGDAKCANFVYISAVIAVNFVAFYCLKIIWLSAAVTSNV